MSCKVHICMNKPRMKCPHKSSVHEELCRLVERYLQDSYNPQQLSTYALTLYRHKMALPDGGHVDVGMYLSTHFPRHSFTNCHDPTVRSNQQHVL